MQQQVVSASLLQASWPKAEQVSSQKRWRRFSAEKLLQLLRLLAQLLVFWPVQMKPLWPAQLKPLWREQLSPLLALHSQHSPQQQRTSSKQELLCLPMVQFDCLC